MRYLKAAITPECYRSARGDVLKAAADKLLRQLPNAHMLYLTVEAEDVAYVEPIELKPTLYISGPMTGLPDWNYPAFREAAQALRADGWEVIDPSEHFEGETGLPRHKYLAKDVYDLITKCRGIVLLDNWNLSEGARLEAQIGIDRGYEFFMWREDFGLVRVSRTGVAEVLA